MVSKNIRKQYRINEDTYARVGYWANRKGMSINDYVVLAIEEKIARENFDFDVPNELIGRINQLIDGVKTLSGNVEALESVTIAGFDSLVGLTRGDNYLLDEEV